MRSRSPFASPVVLVKKNGLLVKKNGNSLLRIEQVGHKN